MFRKLFLYFIFMIFFLAAQQSRADEVFEYNRSIRALGMGNVYSVFVRDVDATTVNPAALAFVSAITWELIDATFGINGVDAYNQFKDVTSISSPSDYDQIIGKKIWVSLFARTALVMPYFGFTAYNEGKLSGVIRNPAYPQFDVNFLNDTGLALAGALPIGPLASVGFGVKRVTRWGGDQSIGLGVIASGGATLADQFQNRGIGYGFDLAFMLKVPGPLNPSLAVTWMDVGSTAFSKISGADAPPRIQDNLSLGLGSTLDLPGLDLSAGMEYRHITETGIQIGKKINFGAEVSLPFIDLRAGLSQGYPSYGVAFNFFFMKFEAASYKVETGEYPGQSPESRIQLGLSLELSVDADFKFYAKDGKKRKLKQRR
ncbi:MAG: hypothetical protein AABY64_05185 [Bdellovibrionota bacterium]